MKRYAAHFLFLPGYGYLKQYAIEVKDGRVARMFFLSEEVENVEWLPGVIMLVGHPDSSWIPYLLYPFDFTTMRPVSGTRHRQLP